MHYNECRQGLVVRVVDNGHFTDAYRYLIGQIGTLTDLHDHNGWDVYFDSPPTNHRGVGIKHQLVSITALEPVDLFIPQEAI